MPKSQGKPRRPDSGRLRIAPQQSGNPVIKHLGRVRWDFQPGLPADFVVEPPPRAVLFHALSFLARQRPHYVRGRLETLQNQLPSRVGPHPIVLVVVDTGDIPITTLTALNHDCLYARATLLLAWSLRDAAQLLELLVNRVGAGDWLIRARPPKTPLGQAERVLTAIPGITKANVLALLQAFGSLVRVFAADQNALEGVPGIGPVRAERLALTFAALFQIPRA